MLNNFYQSFGKRLFDFLIALVGIILLIPFFLIFSILIKISSPGSIFFKQKRVGQNLKLFSVYKFRSMVLEAPKIGLAITSGDDPRITKIGKIIRKYKIDELPQLLNVILGDMSLVGSRPEVEKYVEIYKSEYEQILRMRPGITDLASLKYKDENSLLTDVEDKEKFYIEEILTDKLRLNKIYLKKCSFLFDLKIIIDTIFNSTLSEN